MIEHVQRAKDGRGRCTAEGGSKIEERLLDQSKEHLSASKKTHFPKETTKNTNRGQAFTDLIHDAVGMVSPSKAQVETDTKVTRTPPNRYFTTLKKRPRVPGVAGKDHDHRFLRIKG